MAVKWWHAQKAICQLRKWPLTNDILSDTWRICHTPFQLVKLNWGRGTHICVSKLTIVGSDNGLSPGRRQAIIWTNAGILLIGPLGTNFSEILIKIHIFSLTKMHLKMLSTKWRPFCLGLNVLNILHSSTERNCRPLHHVRTNTLPKTTPSWHEHTHTHTHTLSYPTTYTSSKGMQLISAMILIRLILSKYVKRCIDYIAKNMKIINAFVILHQRLKIVFMITLTYCFTWVVGLRRTLRHPSHMSQVPHVTEEHTRSTWSICH